MSLGQRTRRLVALLVAAVALLATTTTSAQAVSNQTSTGQTLTATILSNGIANGVAGAHGTVTLTEGEATISSVVVTINGHDPITVVPEADGSFEVSRPADADEDAQLDNMVQVLATASDGTTAGEGVVLVPNAPAVDPTEVPSGSPSAEPTRASTPVVEIVPTKPVATVQTLPNTGPAGPRTLGPIGVALAALGLGLIWLGRTAGSRRKPSENRVLIGVPHP